MRYWFLSMLLCLTGLAAAGEGEIKVTVFELRDGKKVIALRYIKSAQEVVYTEWSGKRGRLSPYEIVSRKVEMRSLATAPEYARKLTEKARKQAETAEPREEDKPKHASGRTSLSEEEVAARRKKLTEQIAKLRAEGTKVWDDFQAAQKEYMDQQARLAELNNRYNAAGNIGGGWGGSKADRERRRRHNRDRDRERAKLSKEMEQARTKRDEALLRGKKLQAEVNTKKLALDRTVRDLNGLNRDYPPQTAAAANTGAKPQ